MIFELGEISKISANVRASSRDDLFGKMRCNASAGLLLYVLNMFSKSRLVSYESPCQFKNAAIDEVEESFFRRLVH